MFHTVLIHCILYIYAFKNVLKYHFRKKKFIRPEMHFHIPYQRYMNLSLSLFYFYIDIIIQLYMCKPIYES